ncbi:ribonuclease HI family protein [Leuconostoc rapi]|uniref:ribonuclease HI family protein n=1 Tax=Leuconostoc rapi TaxID=1406906 RepID=UPI001956E4FD|nr:ribonuclease HI family protein [Leuconostoc rapi]MBM7435624.1 ribonuclease HI [Leuconostoc rapi]
MMTLYVDAARHIESGRSAAGAVIIINKQQRQLKTRIQVTRDNHEAEFYGLIWALQQLPNTTDMLQVYSDSQILIDALHKNYAKHYQTLVDTIMMLLSSHQIVLSQWIPEKANLGAHNLALQALKNNPTR